jgi:zinc transport system substrate-binding protein
MNFLKKNWLILLLVTFVAMFVVFVLATPSRVVQKKIPEAKLKIVASFYPLAEFARAVGGDYVSVETIAPSGVEPHDYEPTAEQIASLYRADVVLYNGGGLDAWASRVAPDLSAQRVSVVEAARAIPVHLSDGSVSDSAEIFDPHYWLDPVLAQKIVLLIEQTFSIRDADHAEIYQRNAQSYLEKLKQLDVAYRTGLESCKNRTVVSSHDVFAYLAKEYGFETMPIAGLSPDQEPSAGRLAEITKFAKQKQIQAIFFETLVSPKLAQTIADEIGAQTLVFNPLEGLTEEEQAVGKSYLAVMTENLTNLKKGMLCQ